MEIFKSIQFLEDNKDSDMKKSYPISPQNTNRLVQLATDEDTPRYDTLERRSHNNFLDDIYIKYSVNLVEYFSNNREGMRLTGNKHFSKFPYYLFIEERKKQLKEITDRMKKAKMTWRSNETIDFKDQHFLTPLPNKSRKLLNTDKELNEFRLAERLAVMMRIYEYTHGLKSQFAMEEYQEMVNEEKKQSLLYLKDVVNKIEGWWKGIKRKRDKELMEEELRQKKIEEKEREDFNKKYAKYLIVLKGKNKEKGAIKMRDVILKKQFPLKRQFLSKVKILAVCKKVDRFSKYKKMDRNMSNWFKMSMKLSEKDQTMNFSLINKKKINTTVVNKMMYIEKKLYKFDTTKRHINCIRRAYRLYLLRKTNREDIPKEIIIKPKTCLCFIDRYVLSTNLIKRNTLLQTIIKRKDYKLSNDYKLGYYFKKWKDVLITQQQNNKRSYTNKLNTFSIKYLLFSLSDIITNKKKWGFNKIINQHKTIKRLARVKAALKSIASKKMIESLEYNIIKYSFIKASKLLICKTTLYDYFMHWKNKVDSLHEFITLINHHTINLSINHFFNNMRKIDKNTITTYTTTNHGGYDDDNEFKYYCIINRTQRINDFFLLRITLGYNQIKRTIHANINIKSIIKHIKYSKKKKPTTNKASADFIPINTRLSSKYNQFTTTLNQLDKLIIKHYQSNFFHRIVLNHLVNSALHIDNRELISLLKLGQENTYQTVLNRVLDLNLTDNSWENNNNMTLISYVQRFMTDTSTSSNSNNDLIV